MNWKAVTNTQGQVVVVEPTGPFDNKLVAIVEAPEHAALIAAAPALLEACEQALLEFEILAEANVYGGPTVQLRAAIRQAKGES